VRFRSDHRSCRGPPQSPVKDVTLSFSPAVSQCQGHLPDQGLIPKCSETEWAEGTRSYAVVSHFFLAGKYFFSTAATTT